MRPSRSPAVANAIRGGETLVDHFRAVFQAQPEARTYRFLEDGEGEPLSLTNAELDRRVRAIAATLQQRVPAGERALIVCPPGLDYVASFLACLYAGVIAVPVYPPNPVLLKRTLPRLVGVIADARPAVVLAPASIASMARDFSDDAPALGSLSWQTIDDVDPSAASSWRRPAITGGDIAFLQYTSGSTGQPKGVVLNHANLLHNLEAINALFVGNDSNSHGVVWLPPYHDMGLIGGLLQPAYGAFPMTFMSPLAFLKRPGRWLKAISDVGATISGGPNFAYELCISKISEEARQSLDLSTWRVAFTGAEPVRADTIERFTRAFEPCGFSRNAFYPVYGMAEGTLLVSGGDRASEPVVRTLQPAAYAQNRAVEAAAGDQGLTSVGCGRSIPGQDIIIADPEARTRIPDNSIGEIWVSGPSVALAYWGRPVETTESLSARLADTGDGPFLRTGDLGFLRDGELFVTGRCKDLIIIAGQNHYPQDIERSVEAGEPSLRPGCGVAFSVDVDNDERLVIAFEVAGGSAKNNADRIISSIRATVAEEHGLQVHDVVLLKNGRIPKTSSGKLQRLACKAAFLEGRLEGVATWSLSPAVPTVDSADPAPGPSLPLQEVEERIRRAIADVLGVEPQGLDPHQPIASFGLASVDMVGLVGELEQWVGKDLSSTLVWEYPTIESLAGHLAQAGALTPEDVRDDIASQPRSEPSGAIGESAFAIIGMGCRFPGGVASPTDFWRLLVDGVDAITQVPADRWDADEYLAADPLTPGRGSSRWGGFVDGVDLFDPQFFGISPREAAQMDPQQRLLAEVVWEAAEDAGLTAERLAGSDTGVFIGIANGDYGHLAFRDLRKVDAYTGTGNAFSIAANRLSYLWDLRGPSIAVDTACSSSLVAVHQACASLARGESDLAIVGGVNVILSPALMINFSKAGAMASDGRCRAFDASADGYVRSEGAGAVILKRLDRALADSDAIYAVIRGSAVNQDGRTNGLMAPNPHAQQAVLRAAYQDAAVEPETVDYLEAHGTGTLLGDPIEAKAIASVVSSKRPSGRECLVGSVKTNIGHLEAAAGIAGLIKGALMVHHRLIPSSLHFERPNPHISFEKLALRVADTIQPWPSSGRPAVVGVSAFGFGGTNAHVVIEEAPKTVPADMKSPPGEHVLALSARTEQALRDLSQRYEDHLGALEDDQQVAALCATTTMRRTHHEHRLTCAGSTRSRLMESLAAFRRDELRPGLASGSGGVGRYSKTAFIFSGQGPRWWPVASDLLAVGSGIRRSLEECDEILKGHVAWRLLDLFADAGQGELLTRPEVGQPALCAIQISLAALWRQWGVVPTTVIGHSVGEIAAAHVAGAVSLEDALLIALRRGEIISTVLGHGKMALVDAPVSRVSALIEEISHGKISVAAVNGPDSTIVSGDGSAILALRAQLEALDVESKVLESVDFASHSSQMDDPALELGRQLAGLRTQPTTTAMFSTALGRIVGGTELGADYWAMNLRAPVMFHAGLTSLVESGHDAFVEIAPHPMLASNAQAVLESMGRTGVAVSSLRRDTPGRSVLLEQVGTLHCAGVSVDWSQVESPDLAPLLALPTYPWQRERCWLDVEGSPHEPANAGHRRLAEHSVAAGSGDHLWNVRADLQRLPYLVDHQVDGAPVLPASLIIESALSAARAAVGITDIELLDISLHRMTVVDELTEEPTLQVTVSPLASGSGTFTVFGRRASSEVDAAWERVASGRFRPTRLDQAGYHLAEPLDEVRKRCAQVRPVEQHYAALRRQHLEYGPAFQVITELWTGHGEALARLRDDGQPADGAAAFAVHPAVLDGCLQVLGAAMPQLGLALPAGGADGVFLPTGVARFSAGAEHLAPVWVRAVVPGPVADGEITGARVTLYDEAGIEIGELDGITLRQLEPPSLDADIGDALYELEWTQDPAVDRPVVAASPSGWWLILADDGGLAESVRARLESDDVACVVVARGPRRESPGRLEIDSLTPADLAWVRERLDSFDLGPCAGVLCAWALDLGQRDELPHDGERMLAQAMDEAFLPVMRLVQDMVGHEQGEQPPSLVVLTRGAQRLPDDGGPGVGVAQSVLWGLMRVVAAEHPELRPRILDLDPAGSTDDVRFVLAEMAADSARQSAVREGRRYRAHLRSWTPSRPLPQGQSRRTFVESADANFQLVAPDSGVPQELGLVTTRRSQVRPGCVEIAVESAGVNFSDVMKALGLYPGLSPEAAGLGAECAGVVTAVGDGVAGLAPGDAVMAIAPGSIGAYVTTAAHLVAPRPLSLTSEQSAAAPVAFLTAVYALERLARLQGGERVLIHSATGGVGLAAIQVARRCGAEVFATAGTPEKRQLLRDLGVAQVMDSRSTRFVEQIMDVTAGRGVDVVLNSLGGDALVRSLSVLAPHGRFIELGKTDIYSDSRIGLGMFKENRSLHALDMEHRFAEEGHLIEAMFARISADLESGSLVALPVTCFVMSDVADAFTLMARAGHIGKVVLSRDGRELVTEHGASARIRADGTYLITGGMGALGLHVAESLVDRGALHVVLMGRHGPSTHAASRVDALRRAGATITIILGDVARHGEVLAAMVEIDAGLPALAGVIHAAGHLDDALVLQLDDERVRALAEPKVAGAWNLHLVTMGRDLDLFVLFSSAAGILGSEGQAAYAGANAFLDALAEHRRASGLTGTSIDWGPWSDGGLATGAVRHGGLESLGILSIRPDQGVEALHRILANPAGACVMALPLDLDRVSEAATSGLLPSLLAELADPPDRRARRGDVGSVMREQLLGVEPGPRRREMLVRHCQRETAQVLRLAPEAVNVRAPLASLGFDSLMSLELRKRLQATLGLDLPATMAWRYPSIDAMVPYLAQAMGICLDEGSGTAGPSTGGFGAVGAVAAVGDGAVGDTLTDDCPFDGIPDDPSDTARLEELLLQQIDDMERQTQP